MEVQKNKFLWSAVHPRGSYLDGGPCVHVFIYLYFSEITLLTRRGRKLQTSKGVSLFSIWFGACFGGDVLLAWVPGLLSKQDTP